MSQFGGLIENSAATESSVSSVVLPETQGGATRIVVDHPGEKSEDSPSLRARPSFLRFGVEEWPGPNRTGTTMRSVVVSVICCTDQVTDKADALLRAPRDAKCCHFDFERSRQQRP